jgi:hypothetical protein
MLTRVPQPLLPAALKNGGGLLFLAGSVFNLNAPLTINNCTANVGGGILLSGAQILANSPLTLLHNSATNGAVAGGGMYLSIATATLNANATFERNIGTGSGAAVSGMFIATREHTQRGLREAVYMSNIPSAVLCVFLR